MSDQTVTVLRAKGVLDVDLGEVLEGASVVIEGNRITAVTDDPTAASGADQVIDLPDLTLVPGLMDMEVDLVLGGPGAGLSDPVRMDPVKMGLRAVANGQRTLRRRVHDGAQPRPVHQDRRLPGRRRPRRRHRRRLGRRAAGHPRRPRHLSHRRPPRPERAERPGARASCAMTVEEGIADGINEVRKAVRYQITHGAKLIKCCASGGVMTPTGPPGAQQYSTEELTAIADEAHRRGLRVATHATATRRSTPRSTPASTASSTG